VAGWSAASYGTFAKLAEDESTGVVMRAGSEMHRRPEPDPWWRGAVPDLTRVARPEAPFVDGWSFVSPVIEMRVYLPWLAGRVAELGGTVTRMALTALPTAADVVVNASGLGARLMASDPTVVPVRGQVVYVEQFGLDRWWLEGSGPVYVIPRSHDIVVGGTDDEGDWSRTPAPETARAILARATRLVPELKGARVLRHKVGLRPVRPAVRVERQGSVVHCYGHGGAGVTLSWGCADEVAALVSA
jgi:D-amino-acid oxidase